MSPDSPGTGRTPSVTAAAATPSPDWGRRGPLADRLKPGRPTEHRCPPPPIRGRCHGEAVTDGVLTVPLPLSRAGASLLRLLLWSVLILGLGLAGQGGWGLAKAGLAQVLLDRAFGLDLATGTPHRPWPWADTTAVARLVVPRLGVSQVVLGGGGGQALAFGPARLSQSGEVGAVDTAVFAGHRDTHFRFLGDLVSGDVIRVIRADGRGIDFQVTGTRVVAFDAFGIDRHPDRPRLDLVTCWPLASIQPGPLRLVVSAEAIEPLGVASR